MDVPKTEQMEVVNGGERPSKRASDHRFCKGCGGRLTLWQRIARAEFCTSAHRESYRQARSLQIASMLEQAGPGVPPRCEKHWLPTPTVAGPNSAPKYWPGSGRWQTRCPILILSRTSAPEPQRLQAPFGSERVLEPTDITANIRIPTLQPTAHTSPASDGLPSALLPTAVADNLLSWATAVTSRTSGGTYETTTFATRRRDAGTGSALALDLFPVCGRA